MPASLEIGNDPSFWLWSAQNLEELTSAQKSFRLVLTIGHSEWYFLGADSVTNHCVISLYGGVPPQWEHRTLLEQFKWLDGAIKSVLPMSIFEDASCSDTVPLLMLVSAACSTLPLSVCRDKIPADSLDILFGASDVVSDPCLYHLPETEVVVASRFGRGVVEAVGEIFPGYRLFAYEAAAISRFLKPTTGIGPRLADTAELLICRLDNRILVAQKRNSCLQACNTFEAATPEEVLYYALLLDQGVSGSVFLAGFDAKEEESLNPLLVESFGLCNPSSWILEEPSTAEAEPWNQYPNVSTPALAAYLISNPI